MSTELTPLLITKGISKWLHESLDVYPSMIPEIFHVESTTSRVVDHQALQTYGLPSSRTPGTNVLFQGLYPGYGKRYVVVDYAMGDFIPVEDWDDDEYGVYGRLLPKQGGALARAFVTLREYSAATFIKNDVLGTSSTAFGDGAPLCYSAHPISPQNPGQTASNRPAVDGDLSVYMYTLGSTNLRTQYAPDGVTILRNQPEKLIIHPANRYVARQILRGDWYPGTADRNVNFIKEDNVQIVEWPYFLAGASSTQSYQNAWVLQGSSHHMYWINRQAAATVRTDFAINSLSYVWVANDRFVVGASDWRGIYGSPGKS